MFERTALHHHLSFRPKSRNLSSIRPSLTRKQTMAYRRDVSFLSMTRVHDARRRGSIQREIPRLRLRTPLGMTVEGARACSVAERLPSLSSGTLWVFSPERR